MVEGDYIGVDASGTVALGNGASGVAILAGASDNTIGGTPGTGDVISGNVGNGVYISDSGTTGNVVENAFIGTDATGSYALGNGQDGVTIRSGATNNTVGSRQRDLGQRPVRRDDLGSRGRLATSSSATSSAPTRPARTASAITSTGWPSRPGRRPTPSAA